ncbi:SDR family NAD(P)-dependent oxidoreductase [Palleronia sediminis]|uniref:SDR family NAD(P)-dependent oxidoreductase n=1 Tax=Palleronia sediminis TaxID=2547833 RepID=A0A4R6A3K1_9RHOB|nr:SDR family NAD(P)-dependent oxidoreductase [Palleronia sediminis]TDL78211.1 SDR family NAD(P)-dependent oxidoreductase [Palleronia sediminis]
MADLDGRVAMITGASRGIGAAAARAFAAAGARVALLARSRDEIAAIAGEIGADRALAIPCDISRFWEVEAAAEACRAAFGGLDVLVNNAGVIAPIAPLHEADPDRWGHLVDINLKGAFHGMRAVLPGMIAQGAGTVLTVSSGAAHGPVEGWSAYCASKAGAAMLTRSAHLEAGPRGLRVMGLSPGTVATDMQRAIKGSGVRNRVSELDWSDHVPPEWPARALVWMCGPEADPWLGEEISLRDEGIRRAVGLSD